MRPLPHSELSASFLFLSLKAPHCVRRRVCEILFGPGVGPPDSASGGKVSQLARPIEYLAGFVRREQPDDTD